VPRLYQLLYHRIRTQMHRQGAWKAYLFEKTLEYGMRRYHAGGQLNGFAALADAILDRLVRNRVRALFGGRLKALVSGGAPLPFDVGLFFTALGVKILQGYGQTEAAPLISCNGRRVKLDTVGPPVQGVDLRIADDGEILVRGGMVMLGYWNREQETAETLIDGWLHTGDVGELDEDGYLKITDRKKDVIITTGGGVVAPQYVQDILSLRPEVDQAAVFGDRESHLTAVVVPADQVLRLSGDEDDTALHQALATAIEKANEELGPEEQVRHFVVAGEPFKVENGLLTSTLKLRRDAILERYREAIEEAAGEKV
jgi:long-chain acyl-CoA synthetase